VPRQEDAAELPGEADEQQAAAERGQQPSRDSDQGGPGGPLGAGEAADVRNQALAVGTGDFKQAAAWKG
jgi:hypothetical protein